MFEPRDILKNNEFVKANFAVTTPQQARAMAWHLLDRGTRMGCCTTCGSEQSRGPFKACIVPQDEDALGACTNCWYMKRAAGCSHRPGQFLVPPIPRVSLTSPARPSTPTKKFAGLFDGFTPRDVHEATDEHLKAWTSRIETELRRRTEEKTPKTTRGRKRAAMDG